MRFACHMLHAMLGPHPADRSDADCAWDWRDGKTHSRTETDAAEKNLVILSLSALFFLSHVFFPFFSSKTVIICSALPPQAQAAGPARAKKVLTDDLANNHILDSEQNQSSNDHGSNSMNLCNCLFESTFQFGFDTLRLHHKYFTVCFFLAFVIHKGYVHLQKECHHLFFLQPSDVSFRLLRLVRFERKAMTALVLVRVGGSSRAFRNRRGYRLRRGQCPSIPT